MQHAASISAEEQQQMMAQYTAAKAASDGDRAGIFDLLKSGFGFTKTGIKTVLSCLSPSNVKDKYHLLRSMTFKQLIVSFFRLNFSLVLSFFTFLMVVIWTFFKFIYVMMRGEYYTPPAKLSEADKQKHARKPLMASRAAVAEMLPDDHLASAAAVDAFGFGLSVVKKELPETKSSTDEQQLSVTHNSKGTAGVVMEDGGFGATAAETSERLTTTEQLDALTGSARPSQPTLKAKDKRALNVAIEDVSSEQVTEDFSDMMHFDELEVDKERPLEAEPPVIINSRGITFWKFILSLFARNFYTFKLIALALAFSINIMLLFFKVSKGASEIMGDEESDGDSSNGGGEDEDDESLELVSMEEKVAYLAPVLRIFALLHTFAACAMILGYYCLKVPLVVFKREKEVSRSLEFEGMWIENQPSDDDIKGHWDKLVISTQSFPDKYWDKFVKKKVRIKYSEQYDYEQISNLLGMENKDGYSVRGVDKKVASILPSFLTEIDWQYQVWKFGIIFTDNAFLYIAFYFLFSLLGNFNYFFYAAHLLDVAVCFKTLGTILQSVTHNGKQLVLTVMLLSIIVYLYTVIAFNFFRKFYIQEEEGEEPDYKCHDMLSCYIFHLYVGVRAGGGIGDEINPPDGDPYEVYRILFDITFFFFVIVILLAIIQGLIIDAFGELRDQLEQVKEDLESSCFICGIGKDYFDKLPHGFETHVKNEHNFANYMFFLMHLINKPDTEYTGQESYVWGLYQQRSWEFFPVGECFRKQYEDELTRS